MAEWSIINVEKNNLGEVLCATHAMKVPGGMIIRTSQVVGVALVFIPGKDHVSSADVANTWMEDNKIQ